METYITHAIVGIACLLIGVEVQWRRNKRHIERLEGEVLYLGHTLESMDDDDWDDADQFEDERVRERWHYEGE